VRTVVEEGVKDSGDDRDAGDHCQDHEEGRHGSNYAPAQVPPKVAVTTGYDKFLPDERMTVEID